MGWFHVGRKLDLCYGSTGHSDRNEGSRVQSCNNAWLDFFELSLQMQTQKGNKSYHLKFEAMESIANEVKLKA